MSDEPLAIPPVPLMDAAKARDVARAYKAWAGQLTEMGLTREAAAAARDSQSWLTYSISLAQTRGQP